MKISIKIKNQRGKERKITDYTISIINIIESFNLYLQIEKFVSHI